MRCSKAQTWISRRLDGELDDADETALAEHLAKCEACRAYAEELATLELDLLEAPEPTPDFAAGVMKLVEEHPSRRWAVLSRPALFRPVAAVLGVAAALAGFAVGSIFQQPRAQTAPAAPVSVELAASNAVNPMAADSVESVLVAMLSTNEE